MGLFSKILATSDTRAGNWKNIESEEDLAQAIAESFHQKIAIFKHSTRCPVSRMVLKKFENEIEETGNTTAFFYLDLLKYRALSNKIEEDLGVVHQSPQLIVIENGKAIRNASHQSIEISLVEF